MEKYTFDGTTILTVTKDGQTVVAGDGQVTLGNAIIKNNANKIRRIGKNKDIVVGFAGSTADAFTLFERLEGKLEKYPDQLMRACVELAKDWRMDKYLRKLEAMMIVANKELSFLLSGNGDVLEMSDRLIGIGSGGAYAFSAARALLDNSKLSAKEIASKAMQIAADVCIYTNNNIVIEEV
jgi:ATP-dependent HslUV protease subunit HslV